MNIFTRFPIRLTIPLFLLLLALLAEGYTMKYYQHLADVEEEKKALALVTQDMTQLQDNISDRLRKGDREGVQSAIAGRGSNPNITVVVLVDDAGAIIGSTSRKLVGVPVSRALPDVDAALLMEVGTTLTGRVSLSDDRRLVTACYPVILGAKGREIRPHRVGILYLRYDLTSAKAIRRHGLERQALVMAGFYAGCFLLLGLFLHLVLAGRVSRLVSAARRFAAGDLSAQTGLQGEDELARIGEAFDRMAGEIARSHEALQNAAVKYRIVADNTYDWEFWLSPASEFIYISPSCKRITGFEADEFRADPGLQGRIVHPDDRSRLAVHRHDVIRRMIPGAIEYRIIGADGAIRWIDHACQPVFDEKGNFLGTRGNNRDITERKQAEEEIRALNAGLEQRVLDRTRALEEVNKELESFSYSVSHDLHAPLRSIEGFSRVLLEDYQDKLDEEGKDYLRRVQAASRRMAVFIDDILDFSRITSSEMQRKRVNMSALAHAIAEELHGTEPQRRVEFIIQEGLAVEGDPQLLRAALENLIGNAWKFTGKHQTARIEVGVMEVDGIPAYFVRDDGSGFDMAYADKLFTPFQRLHSPREYAGSGIGLSIVQRIIHRHGGKVWAEGEVEKGATFYFTLGPCNT